METIVFLADGYWMWALYNETNAEVDADVLTERLDTPSMELVDLLPEHVKRFPIQILRKDSGRENPDEPRWFIDHNGSIHYLSGYSEDHFLLEEIGDWTAVHIGKRELDGGFNVFDTFVLHSEPPSVVLSDTRGGSSGIEDYFLLEEIEDWNAPHIGELSPSIRLIDCLAFDQGEG